MREQLEILTLYPRHTQFVVRTHHIPVPVCALSYLYFHTFQNLFVVLTKDGAKPIKYGIKLNSDDKYRDIRKPLSKFTDIPEDKLLFIELNGPHVKVGKCCSFQIYLSVTFIRCVTIYLFSMYSLCKNYHCTTMFSCTIVYYIFKAYFFTPLDSYFDRHFQWIHRK